MTQAFAPKKPEDRTMQPTRRQMLATTGVLIAAAAALPATAPMARAEAPPADPRLAPRSLGKPDARPVEEWFSFTCPHCARFAADVLPQIRAQLIDTGKIRYVFREYPRDQTDLMAAMVARSLPAERYEPFMMELFRTQAHWAFDRSVEPKDELAKMAALAGMPREMFDQVTADEGLKAAILGAQAEAEKTYSIESTPTFIIDGHVHSGEVTYDTFAKWLVA
jgi:protein-disulfide isomerase